MIIAWYNELMADFVFVRKSRNIASSAVHIFLNLLLGIGSVFVTIISGSPLIGIILVLASKWRVFAVRPRYIPANFKASLVDLIVGISIVVLTHFSGTTILPVHIILAAIYSIWLLFIKPLTSETANLIQSVFAVFIGISAATIMATDLDSIVIVILAGIIGYSASRHILIQSDEHNFSLTTFTCGLIFSEIAWLCHAWTRIYTFNGTGIRIPQLAIILTIYAFVYNYTRQTIIKNKEDFSFKDILPPVMFAIILITIIVLWFSEPAFNI